MSSVTCPQQYALNDSGQCVHYLFPLTNQTIIGCILIAIITGLTSLAGIGSGGPALAVFISFFNYLPKDANIIIFTSTFGATLGNCLNQMTKAHNGRPVIQYKYSLVCLPIMFVAGYFGVWMNSFLPSLGICAIFIILISNALPKLFRRFRMTYEKQTQQILMHKTQTTIDDLGQGIIKQERINPFNKETISVLINIGILMAVFILLMFFRGTQKIPSLIGIQRCGTMYWMMLLISLAVMCVYAYFNIRVLKKWQWQSKASNSQNNTQLKTLNPKSDQLQLNKEQQQQIPQTHVEKNFGNILYFCTIAGFLGGLGFGGGAFIVSLHRMIGFGPLQATSSASFIVAITMGINCIQGYLLGVIQLQDFLFFMVVAGGGSFLISYFLSKLFRKMHRLSLVELFLFILMLITAINIPGALLLKYIRSGYNSSLILKFGRWCS